MATSALKKIEALENQKTRLIEAARSEIIERIELELAKLAELGFDYSLVEKRVGRKQNGAGAATRSSRGRVTDTPCTICGFKTDRPHDARAHRWQEPKAPFSKKELNERGLRRVR